MAPSHYLNKCWNSVNWTQGNIFQWNFNQNTIIFIQENAFGNVVCKMPTILFKSSMCWTKFWKQCRKSTSQFSPIQAIQLMVEETVIYLTLNMRGPSYLGLTESISWLLMPWLLTSPGHQQPWYWLCRIRRFLSYLRKDFNNLRRINVEKWHKM